MDIAVKAAAAGIIAVLAGSLIKKNNAEISLIVSLAACAAILIFAVKLGEGVMEVMNLAKDMSGLSSALLTPVLKCVGIGIIAKIGADVCRDADSESVAGSVELAGALAAVFVALPLMRTLLGMMENLT